MLVDAPRDNAQTHHMVVAEDHHHRHRKELVDLACNPRQLGTGVLLAFQLHRKEQIRADVCPVHFFRGEHVLRIFQRLLHFRIRDLEEDIH